MLVRHLALCVAAVAASAPPPPPQVLQFSFDSALGDNMLLQMAPAKAAVYGFLDFEGSMTGAVVRVTLTPDSGAPMTVEATLNSTVQTFGPDWGVRNLNASQCPGCLAPFNPWNTPLASWKALLPPQPAGGNYTITAVCTGCSATAPSTISIANVIFGDMWYCTGQSNMWLPVLHTYWRNETARNITAGRYANLRLMAGGSGSKVRAESTARTPATGIPWPAPYGGVNGSNPWMTTAQAAPEGCIDAGNCPLFAMGATCWYFAQGLADLGVTTPIGIADTAIGGQRIEEFIINSTASACQEGENNMGNVKGNAPAGVGYSCLMRQLIQGYRAAWSATPGTTDPLAPFGVVALPSGGSEGGPNMGAMRIAQTAGYGTLPSIDLPNTFIAQAYDLEDQWGSNGGPCFGTPPGYGPNVAWACCAGKQYNASTCAGREALCAPACEAAAGTSMIMGGIHPRSKKPVGERLARGAFNTAYGGTGSITGPTISSCATAGAALTIEFNASSMRGDSLVLQPFFPSVKTRYVTYGGTLLWALTNATTYCMEPQCVMNATSGRCATTPNGRAQVGDICPTWAGGDGVTVLPVGGFNAGWVELNYTLSPSGTGIVADLAPLNGTAPAGIRFAWDQLFCCDLTDPNVYVTHDCIEQCPIMSSARLPANPFHARITAAGTCTCQAPQVCS